jgi:diacylglycerol kinase (ATP)
LGLDAEAAHLANGRFRHLPGLSRYLAGALFALRTFRPVQIEAQIDDRSWAGRVVLAAVANAPCYGSGIRVAPQARMDDGWLNVTLVGAMAWPQVLEAIPVVLRKQDWTWESVWQFRARKVTLRASRPVAFQGDGEVLGEAPVELEVLPGAIRVALAKR